ncbi:hypothetical protein BH10CHL1_BH10CHL1_49570 [soil metagenome]
MSKLVETIVLAGASLSSFAYIGGEILFVLVVVSGIYSWLAMPLTVVLAALLLLLALTCYQAILAYPGGGGAYIIARDNGGELTAQVAGAALVVDCILTIAVSLAFATDQMTSAFPALVAYKVPISLCLILLITCVNLRGAKESNTIFVIATYCFVVLIFGLISVGFWQAWAGTLGVLTDRPLSAPSLFPYTGFVFVFLLLRMLNSGTWAINRAWTKNAAGKWLWDAALLLSLFLGISLLSGWIHVQPTETGALISQVARTVYGDGLLWLLTLAAMTVVLLMAANHSLTDFSRLAALQAGDGCLPNRFAARWERPILHLGLLTLAVLASLLIIFFQGRVHRLIPLYTLTVFFCFTFVQLGMAKRWHRIGALMQTGSLTSANEISTLGSCLSYDRFWHTKRLLNGVGGCISGLITLYLLLTNFIIGAWLIILLIIILSWSLMRMQHHHKAVAHLLRTAAERVI